MPNVATLEATIDLNDTGFQQGAQRTVRSTKEIISESTRLEKAWDSLERKGRDISGLGQVLTLGVSAALGGALVGAGAASMKMEQLNSALRTTMGSSAAASAELQRLNETAKMPGLALEQAIMGSVRLQQVGMHADTADRVLRGMGNALASVGGSASQLDGVVLALTQMQAKGKVSAEEINQMAERIPQIRRLMTEAFGTADTEVLQKKGLSTDEFITGILTQLEKLPPAAATSQTSMDNLGDALLQTGAKVGNSFMPVVRTILDVAVPAIEKFGNTWEKIPQPIAASILVLGALAVATGPALLGMGLLVTSAQQARVGYLAVAPAIRTLIGLITGKATAQAAGAAVEAAANGVTAATTLAQGAATVATEGHAVATTHDALAVELALNTRRAHFVQINAETAAIDANTAASLKNAMAQDAAAASIAKGQAVRGLGARMGLGAASFVGGMGLGTVAAVGVAGVVAGDQVAQQFERRQGLNPDQTPGDWWKHLNPFRTAEDDARDQGQTLKEAREYAKANSDRVRSQREADKATRAPKEMSTENLLKIEDAQYDAMLQQAKAVVASAPEESEAQRELETLLPLLEGRIKSLRGRADALRPTIEKNAEDAQEYWKLQKEISSEEERIVDLRQAAAKEQTDAAKRAREKQIQAMRAMTDMRNAQIENWMRMQEVNLSAQSETDPNRASIQRAEVMRPAHLARQASIVDTARMVMETSPEGPERAKELMELEGAWWDVQGRMQQEILRAQQAQERIAKKAQDDAEKIWKLQWSMYEDQARAQIAGAEQSQRAAETLRVMQPILLAQMGDLKNDIDQMSEDSVEYWQAWREYASKERELAEMERSAQKEAADNRKKATEDAKKARREQDQIMDAEFRLVELRLRNDMPDLSEDERNKRLIPLLRKRYDALQVPIEGETPYEALQREIEAEQTKARAFDMMRGKGKMQARVLGGGTLHMGARGLTRAWDDAGDDSGGSPMDREIQDVLGRMGTAERAKQLARETAPDKPLVLQLMLNPVRTQEELDAEVLRALHGQAVGEFMSTGRE